MTVGSEGTNAVQLNFWKFVHSLSCAISIATSHMSLLSARSVARATENMIFFFFFLGLNLQHVEVLRLGVKSEL